MGTFMPGWSFISVSFSLVMAFWAISLLLNLMKPYPRFSPLPGSRSTAHEYTCTAPTTFVRQPSCITQVRSPLALRSRKITGATG